MEGKIRKAIEEALVKAEMPSADFRVEWPANMKFGDYSTNVAIVAGAQHEISMTTLANKLARFLTESLADSAETVEVAGPGFINITLKPEVVAQETARIATLGKEWGKGTINEGKRIAIEYACPNPFKEMHIGHLMSTIIGESVARLVENSGAKVIRDTYGGDVGPHVARALWALRRDGVTDVASAAEVDKAYLAGARAYEESEQAKAEIDSLNKLIYQATDPEITELWRKCREVCLESFREIFKVLGTSFDYYFFESEVTPIGLEVVRDGLKKGVFRESEGAVIYPGEEKGLHTLVFITSHDTPTYEAKDIGLAFYKEERFESDAVIIETGAEQVGHFKVFLAALSEIAPAVAAKMSHISHGLMVDLNGKKLSSRLGNAATAAGILNDLIARAAKKNPDPLIAEQVVVAAIKYLILRQAPGGNVVFDPEKSLSLEGDSGPYLQYALVRAKSVVAAANGTQDETVPAVPYLLERMLIRYPEVANKACVERAPHHVTQYLTQLASEWNSFYAKERIVGGEHETYKLKVARAFITTMENGLTLLGIPTPEKM